MALECATHPVTTRTFSRSSADATTGNLAPPAFLLAYPPSSSLGLSHRDTCYAENVLWHGEEQAPIFGTNLKVRLLGLDAPELRSQCLLERCLAHRAKRVLEAFITNGGDPTLRLQGCVRDKYFRLTCDIVRPTGESAVDTMLRSGLAVRYDGQAKLHDWCSPASASTLSRPHVDACRREL